MLGIPELTTATIKLASQVKVTGAAIVSALDRLTLVLIRLEQPPSPHSKPLFRLIQEDGSMLVYEVTLPALDPASPNSADVVRGELRLAFDGVDQPAIETARDQVTLSGVKITQGVKVTGSFVFVDDAGNVSANPAVVAEFVAADTIPPSDPAGGVSFTAVSEEA